MLRAVPATTLTAASRSFAFRTSIFSLGDFLELCTSDFANFFSVRFARTLLDPNSFADEVVNWTAEAVPVKRTVFKHTDVHDDVFTLVFLGSFVERVYEVHHVEAPLT